MRKRRFTALLAAVVTVCCLSGCQDSANLKQTENTLNAEAAEIKTVEPPQDGWTLDQLNDVIYMNGQKIELPIIFSTLNDGYEIRDKKRYDNLDSESGLLYYKDDFIAIISFYETNNDYTITNLFFPPSYYEENQEISDYIIFNGFGLDNSASNVEKYLGNKFEKDSGFYVYVLGDEEYTILISDKEKYMIAVFEGVSRSDN